MANRRPNILLTISDDVTYSTLGCYGGPNVPTPNIDSLAADGVKFNKAYLAMAMCSPCRQELYSGLYPPGSGGMWNHSRSLEGTQSICQHLRGLGYRVGLTGKHHAEPTAIYDFDEVEGFERNCCKRGPRMRADHTEIRQYMTYRPEEPFFLVIGLVDAHGPWTTGDPGRFDPAGIQLPPYLADLPEVRGEYVKYLAEVGELDRHVGNILRTLEEIQKADDTLVIFTSEQGASWPGCKWTNWEDGLHTAFIARWPGVIQPGQQTNALVQYADVVPTLIAAGGGEPDRYQLDGTSFLDVLTGDKDTHRKYAYGMHNNIPEGTPYPIRTVCTDRFRYIRNLTPQAAYYEKHLMQEDYWLAWVEAAKKGNPSAQDTYRRYVHRPHEQLYDNDADPHEMNDLAQDSGFAEVKAELSGELDRWMQAQQDPGAALDCEQEYLKRRSPDTMARKQRSPDTPASWTRHRVE